MEKGAFLDLLRQGLQKLDLPLGDEQCDQLFLYFTELRKWSRKINLIAKGASDQEVIDKHFLDSLVLLKSVAEQDACLLDIGTGAGFPGLVCAAAMPGMKVILVEPRLKRVTFLNHIIRTLGLKHVDVRATRIEDEKLIPSSEPITHVTSRAVNEIGLFCKMVKRFGKEDISVVFMKGPKWEEELNSAREQHGVIVSDYAITKTLLPFSQSERYLIECKLGNIQII